MKSTSVARQAIMHDVCNAPYVADCPADGCGKCRFNGLNQKACVQMYEGHDGFMGGVKSYGDHCRTSKSACTPDSAEASTINGITYLLQDYIRRGICEVNVDEWDDFVLVQIIVYDDVVVMKRYRLVQGMFPDSIIADNKTYKPLPKPIRILVELGSKDSVEYKNSEEYKKEQSNKTEKQQMTNQLMLTQVRLVYEYLCDEATRCKNGSAPLSLPSHQHVLETARNGLFMIIRDTLGEGYDEGYEEKMEAVGKDEELPPPVEPKKLEEPDLVESALNDAKKEEIMDTIRRKENKVVSDMNHDLGGAPLRYCGEAMLKDDIVRSSMYDLSGAKFTVGPVDFAGYAEPIDPHADNVPTWRARAVFTVGDCDVQFWFEFDEEGSAIANSVKAFDRMIHDGILHRCFDYKPVPEDMGACKGGENE